MTRRSRTAAGTNSRPENFATDFRRQSRNPVLHDPQRRVGWQAGLLRTQYRRNFQYRGELKWLSRNSARYIAFQKLDGIIVSLRKIGFDCAHYGDAQDHEAWNEYFPDTFQKWQSLQLLHYCPGSEVRSKGYCEEQCRQIVHQLIEMQKGSTRE